MTCLKSYLAETIFIAHIRFVLHLVIGYQNIEEKKRFEKKRGLFIRNYCNVFRLGHSSFQELAVLVIIILHLISSQQQKSFLSFKSIS